MIRGGKDASQVIEWLQIKRTANFPDGSGQHQSVCDHRHEILAVACRQLRMGSDGDSGDAAVRKALCPSPRQIEKLRRLFGIGLFKCLRIGQQSSRESLRRRRKRPAEKFAPCDRADPQRLTGTKASPPVAPPAHCPARAHQSENSCRDESRHKSGCGA